MLKRLIYIFLGLSIITLFIFGQSSAALSPYIGIEVGDKFEFQFSKFEIQRYINGSKVIDEDGFELVNNKINITVNEIKEGNDGFFKELYGGSTVVNVTETFKRGVFPALTMLDSWFFLYYQVELVFDDLVTFVDPEEGSTIELFPPDTNDYSNFAGLPAFATTNTSFYEALEKEVPDFSGTPSMTPDRAQETDDSALKLNRFTQVSLQDGIFKMNITNGDMRAGYTSAEEPYYIEGRSYYYVEINTQQGVVNTLSWKIQYTIQIGEYSDDFIYEVIIDNLNPQTTTQVDFQLYQSITITICGLLLIRLVRRRN